MDHIMKQIYHSPLICWPSILQSEGHDLVAKGAPLHNEGCHLHVFRSHPNLIIVGETIREREDFMMSNVIDQDINMS